MWWSTFTIDFTSFLFYDLGYLRVLNGVTVFFGSRLIMITTRHNSRYHLRNICWSLLEITLKLLAHIKQFFWPPASRGGTIFTKTHLNSHPWRQLSLVIGKTLKTLCLHECPVAFVYVYIIALPFVESHSELVWSSKHISHYVIHRSPWNTSYFSPAYREMPGKALQQTSFLFSNLLNKMINNNIGNEERLGSRWRMLLSKISSLPTSFDHLSEIFWHASQGHKAKLSMDQYRRPKLLLFECRFPSFYHENIYLNEVYHNHGSIAVKPW